MDSSILYFGFHQKVRFNPPDWSGKLCKVGVDEMRENDAFEVGYEAYWDGLDPEDNPFKPDTAE
jgi:hypothetical protein